MLHELDDGRVRVRRYRSGDAEAVYEAVRESVAEIGSWLPWCHPGYSRQDAQQWVETRLRTWEAGEAYNFVVEDAASGELLGDCGLTEVHDLHRFADLGYWVRTGAAGRGIATAAARRVVRFGFAEVGLQRIQILMEPGNRGSLRVAEKLGAVREGVARNRVFRDGRARDAVVFSLIPEDVGLAGE
jgi:RimJ/RimL family protein N-acetyltransferase